VVDALEWNPVLFGAVILAVAAGILIPLTRWSIGRRRSDPEVLQAAVSLASGSFIFISAFVVVTIWQGERDHEGLIVKEFAAAGNLAEDVRWFMKTGQMDPVIGNRLLDDLHAYGQAVRIDELTQVTGLPSLPAAQGSVAADRALQAVGDALDEHAARVRLPEDSALWVAWRNLSDHRVERLALRTPLPDALFGIMVVTAMSTLVLIGLYPAGGDVTVRWIAGAVSTAVVVTVMVAIVLLIDPGAKQVARQGPVDAMNIVIYDRS
jgi:hypothetical protein